MKRLILTILLISVLLFSITACGSQNNDNHLGTVKRNGVLTVGTSPDYPPFETKDANGNKVGFDIDLMTEIAKRMGVKLEWVDIPYNQLIAAIQERKIDAAISGFNYDKDRDEQVDFSEAYYTPEDALIIRDDFTGKLNQPEDLGQFIVGALVTSSQETWLEKNLVAKGLMPNEGLTRYERVDKAIGDLQVGGLNVYMTDYFTAQNLIGENKGLKILYHGLLSGNPMNIAIPQGDREMAKGINDILRQLKSEGFIDKLVVKHLAGK